LEGEKLNNNTQQINKPAGKSYTVGRKGGSFAKRGAIVRTSIAASLTLLAKLEWVVIVVLACFGACFMAPSG